MKKFLRRTLFYRLYKKSKAIIAKLLNWYTGKWLTVIGVTGTNWKTTTCNILHQILNDNLGKTAMISTINVKIWDESIFNDTKMTSLVPMELFKYLVLAEQEGCEYVVLEVSSHALDQYRFYGIDFDGAILTNITPEHLDYHRTMKEYANTKKKLFENVMANSDGKRLAVLPKDDQYGRKWADSMIFSNQQFFGVESSAGIQANNIQSHKDKMTFDFSYMGKDYELETGMLGEFNVYNILAAIAMGVNLQAPIDGIIDSVQKVNGLPGRLEYFKKWNINFYLDYAHTQDALQKVLEYLNTIKWDSRLILVFGAPGVRDKYRRPKMLKIADDLADVVIVTDDDPDQENHLEIINQIDEGIERDYADDYWIMPERYYALKFAVDLANDWDLVVMTGLGHQKCQVTNFGKRDWNDKEQILEIMNNDKG